MPIDLIIIIMKKKYKNSVGIALSVMLCLALTLPAAAQQSNTTTNKPAPAVSTPPARQSNTGVVPQQRSNAVSPAPAQRGYNAPGATPQPQHNANGTTPQRSYGYSGRGNATVTPQRQGYTQRGYYNPNNRAIVAPNRGYRSYPALPYGSNHLTVRPGGGFYYSAHDYYRNYYAPRLGIHIGVLPFGYYPFYFGPDQYFYSAGLFYQFNNNQYTVVEPPVGAAIASLPDAAQSIVINGTQYYEYNGVYYQPVTKDNGTIVYQVAGEDGQLNTDNDPNGQQQAQQALPQVGDMVNNLPDGCRTIKIAGQKYYESSDGYYFQDATDVNGDKGYKIVGTPQDQPGN
jgi:hypothetical protein